MFVSDTLGSVSLRVAFVVLPVWRQVSVSLVVIGPVLGVSDPVPGGLDSSVTCVCKTSLTIPPSEETPKFRTRT